MQLLDLIVELEIDPVGFKGFLDDPACAGKLGYGNQRIITQFGPGDRCAPGQGAFARRPGDQRLGIEKIGRQIVMVGAYETDAEIGLFVANALENARILGMWNEATVARQAIVIRRSP